MVSYIAGFRKVAETLHIILEDKVFRFLDKTGFLCSLGSPPGSPSEIIWGPKSGLGESKSEK